MYAFTLHRYACTLSHMHAFTHTYAHMYTDGCMHSCPYTHMHTHMDTLAHIGMYTTTNWGTGSRPVCSLINNFATTRHTDWEGPSR